jgi:transcriptional regulator
MYVPSRFEVTDVPTLHDFMERFSFATLVTAAGGSPFATHLPLLLDRHRGAFGTLIGHVARANPHAEMNHIVSDSVAIFHGPHGYISPGWYRTGRPHVPTWNYAVVHAYGRLSMIGDEVRTAQIVQRLVSTYESRLPRPWTYDPSDPPYQGQLAAIIGFEMPIDKLEGKFKLNQNRDPVDRVGAIAGLEALGDSDSRALANLMRQHLGIGSSL